MFRRKLNEFIFPWLNCDFDKFCQIIKYQDHTDILVRFGLPLAIGLSLIWDILFSGLCHGLLSVAITIVSKSMLNRVSISGERQILLLFCNYSYL